MDLQNLAAFVLLLGALVFVHELGHFLFAKAVGVKVLRFSIGFGPPLLSFTRGETEYRIAALPLGGYVKMAGEVPGEDAAPEDEARSYLAQAAVEADADRRRRAGVQPASSRCSSSSWSSSAIRSPPPRCSGSCPACRPTRRASGSATW